MVPGGAGRHGGLVVARVLDVLAEDDAVSEQALLQELLRGAAGGRGGDGLGGERGGGVLERGVRGGHGGVPQVVITVNRASVVRKSGGSDLMGIS